MFQCFRSSVSETTHPASLKRTVSFQLNSAAVRAALGLSPPVVDEATAYLQAQAHQRQQQHERHRDLQLQQLLLQEQIEQQVQEQQLRAIGEQLQDFPDLQQHYQSLLITEQLQRRREQVAQAQLRYQEELRRQQLTGVYLPEEATISQQALAVASPPMEAQTPAAALHALEIQMAAREAIPGRYDLGNAAMPNEKRAAVDTSPMNYEETPPAKRMKTSSPDEMSNEGGQLEDVLKTFVKAADMVVPQTIRRGTVEGLLNAADENDKMDNAATIMRKLEKIEWSDSEDEEEEAKKVVDNKIEFSSDPKETLFSPRFKSALPHLPVEPVLEDDTDEEVNEKEQSKEEPEEEVKENEVSETVKDTPDANKTGTTSKNGQKAKKKVSAVLDYPVPIDTWWPSLNGMRRERRNAGETSDEDDFEEAPSLTGERSMFRANERKIRSRLSLQVEPGVLEKVPHCRLHRVRTKRKKNSTAPEFVYCWQVTEIYPNDTILCCSKCGTWRHAACGGHYKTYSARETATAPFEAICENCHEEERFLCDYPAGAKRIDQQRTEHIRRALATSAVMRQASYSKHGGTYKWPLGSVSATHIAGHTRSVHARHDKAEKQWSDMGLRLSRGFGYRPKERVKSRTKELERLMVSVEDAEAYTERHNMIHFLMRDTARDKPVGHENELTNIFDSDAPIPESKADKNEEQDSDAVMETDENVPSPRTQTPCARKGCDKAHRFDSLFCSDACGVAALETDLLQTLFDASEIHPSVLRP